MNDLEQPEVDKAIDDFITELERLRIVHYASNSGFWASGVY